MDVKINLISPLAKIPTYSTQGSAAFDIYATSSAQLYEGTPTAIINTGITLEIPPGYVLLIFSRSGQGFRDNIRLANCVGVIDSDYRGEVLVKLTWDNSPTQRATLKQINVGDRIAQGLLVQVPQVNFIQTSNLSETERGSRGLGSTGV